MMDVSKCYTFFYSMCHKLLTGFLATTTLLQLSSPHHTLSSQTCLRLAPNKSIQRYVLLYSFMYVSEVPGLNFQAIFTQNEYIGLRISCLSL